MRKAMPFCYSGLGIKKYEAIRSTMVLMAIDRLNCEKLSRLLHAEFAGGLALRPHGAKRGIVPVRAMLLETRPLLMVCILGFLAIALQRLRSQSLIPERTA